MRVSLTPWLGLAACTAALALAGCSTSSGNSLPPASFAAAEASPGEDYVIGPLDELTVFVYTRPYPQGNTVEATAGMLTTTEATLERTSPTDLAKREARALLTACAPR